jgi:hypothetical protein
LQAQGASWIGWTPEKCKMWFLAEWGRGLTMRAIEATNCCLAVEVVSESATCARSGGQTTKNSEVEVNK